MADGTKLESSFHADEKNVKLKELNNPGQSFSSRDTLLSQNESSEHNAILFEACDGVHIGGRIDRNGKKSKNKSMGTPAKDIKESYHTAVTESEPEDFYFVDIRDVALSDIKCVGSTHYFLNTGSPHHVRIIEGEVSLEDVDVYHIGKDMRWRLYGQVGANINFVKLHTMDGDDERKNDNNDTDDYEDDDDNDNDGDYDSKTSMDPSKTQGIKNLKQKKIKLQISVRTFERGVEDETLACGTGATASAIVAFLLHLNLCKHLHLQLDSGITLSERTEQLPVTQSEVSVKMRGGELVVHFRFDGKTFTNVKLCGEAKHVFDGVVMI
jgi:diaminopimelate epimerase